MCIRDSPSRDTRVAKTALRDYMVTMIREQDTRATLINNDPNATGFENRYGINPYFLGAQPVKTIDQYAQGEYLEDTGFQNGYQYFKDYNPTGEEVEIKSEVFDVPSQAAIDFLIANPTLSEAFIEKYGQEAYDQATK